MTLLNGTASRSKLSILAVFLLALGLLIHSKTLFQTTNGNSTRPIENEIVVEGSLPPDELIDKFDKDVQSRFVTVPSFGIRRLEPMQPTNPHLEQFQPNSDDERADVAAFESGGWDVGLYLFGRLVTRQTDPKAKEEFDIRYRVFNPIPVSNGLKVSHLHPSNKLVTEIKQAFIEFQKPGGAFENEFRFDRGKWSYVARPVRAVSQSCLQCHKENYVITEKIGNGKFNIRRRRIGDANGVLVYAFAKRDE